MRAILKVPNKIVPLCIAALFFLTIFVNNSPNIIKVYLYPIYREVRKVCFIFDSGDFFKKEVNSFKIYYKRTSFRYVDMIEDNAENSLSKVKKDFDYNIDGKISMFIYPEYREMAEKIGLGTGCIAMGVYYGGIVSILDPSKWIRENENMDIVFAAEGPMVHELTHYIVDYMSRGNVPVWFTEGMALYEEYRINGFEWAHSKSYSEYYDIKELEEKFYELDEVKAYKQSYIIIKYIGDNYGMVKINKIIRELGEGKTVNQAVENTININMNELLKRAY